MIVHDQAQVHHHHQTHIHHHHHNHMETTHAHTTHVQMMITHNHHDHSTASATIVVEDEEVVEVEEETEVEEVIKTITKIIINQTTFVRTVSVRADTTHARTTVAMKQDLTDHQHNQPPHPHHHHHHLHQRKEDSSHQQMLSKHSEVKTKLDRTNRSKELNVFIVKNQVTMHQVVQRKNKMRRMVRE